MTIRFACTMRLSAAVAALALCACATIDPGGAAGPAASEPVFRVGDRWTYRVEDGFRVPVVWHETHEVVVAGPAGIVVRVRAKGERIDVERTERWVAPGVVASGAIETLETRRFEPPLVLFRYPMAPGEQWSQRMRDPDAPPGPYGPIDRYTHVGGYERITTPAGTFDALRIRVLMRLDDEAFWRTPSECNHLVLYAAALGVPVAESRACEYREKGDARVPWAMIRTVHARRTLVSFVRA